MSYAVNIILMNAHRLHEKPVASFTKRTFKAVRYSANPLLEP
jgi:hypothetical protein